MMQVESELFSLRDERYAAFHASLVPGVERERIIGVRMPALRHMARTISLDDLSPLPHRYYEENQLHAIVLSRMRDFDKCLAEVEHFLPFVDNWATCDVLRPRCFAIHFDKLLPHICCWLKSEHEYTVRFAIGMLEANGLGDFFDVGFLDRVAGVHRQEYYIRMMQAWFFATALAKQYEATLPYIVCRRLDIWTHNKAIQKAIESRRVPNERKTYLKKLKVHTSN